MLFVREFTTLQLATRMATGSSAGGEAPPLAAAPTPAASVFGVIGPFDPTQEEWREYAERLVHYFIANDIVSAEKKRAILLTASGTGTLPSSEDPGVAEEAGRADSHRVGRLSVQALQPETVSHRQALRV